MKFPTIAVMFQHIRTTHIDRISSPTTYIEHFSRITGNYNAINTSFRGDDLYKRKLEESLHVKSAHLLKSEQSSPKLDQQPHVQRMDHLNENSDIVSRTPPSRDSEHRSVLHEQDIKQEEQNSPTDLSNKSASIKENGSKSPIETNNNNNNNSSCTIPSPIANHLVQGKSLQQYVSNSGTFLCNQCNAALPNFEAFRSHLKSHLTHGELSNFICHHCGIALANQTDYDRHFLSHFLISNTEYCCTYNCNKTFGKSDDLQKHLFDLHAQNLWKCGICAELFESKVAIQVHFAVGHSNEVKTYRCSACIEIFKTESDFKNHVRARHVPISTATNLQCLFCRTVCASELEMHFHLAAHARQYRCPACPEAFHVEFLLDRHMQTHHCTTPKDPLIGPYKSTNNNNNSILDYHYAVASGGKSLYPFGTNSGVTSTKLFNPLQLETAAVSPHKPSPSLYGFYDSIGKSRYGDLANKHLLNLYGADVATKFYMQTEQLPLPPSSLSATNQGERDNYAVDHSTKSDYYNLRNLPTGKNYNVSTGSNVNDNRNSLARQDTNFACGICERSDFNNEMEVHTHRKVAHNVKTGVSLRCAYCNDNFRSR